MFRFRDSLTSVTLLIGLIVFPHFSIASVSYNVCGNTIISTNAKRPLDFSEICSGADDAVTFFRELNLTLLHPVVVEVVPELPDFMSKTAVGCHLREEQKILILTFTAFQKIGDWFGIPIDRRMYRSLVIHEVAHVIASCNFAISDPSIQAQEYVAYVAMLSMMNPNLRERVLAENPGEGFDSELEMNEIVYSLDPMHFGVEAYRHYLKQEQGTTFLLRVLSGEALTNRGIEWPNLLKSRSSTDAS